MSNQKAITPTIQPLPKQDKAWEYLLNNETKYLLFGGGAGGGKAQPLDANICTPNGFKKMSDIEIGDIVSSLQSNAEVIAIHPQGIKDIYEVEFIDGAKTKVTEEHLWDCWIAGRLKGRKIRTTKEIQEIIKTKNVLIPMTEVNFIKRDLKVEPYVMGAMLGDGGLTKHLTLTTEDKEILEEFKKRLPFNIKIRQTDKIQYSLVQDERNEKGYPINKLAENFKDYGLLPIACKDRFIPKDYLFNSKKNRILLLQGLLDTDGYIDKRGHISFCSKSIKLAEGVQFLVRSLGGKATLKKTIKGFKEFKDEYCEVYIRLQNDLIPFRLQRKRERIKPYNGKNCEVGRRIKKINFVGKEKAQCITVENNINGSHLYVTDDFILTHNSWLGCEWLLVMCETYPETKWFIARKELKRLMQSSYVTFKKVCKYHNIPDNHWKLNGQYNYIEFFNGSRIDLLDVNELPSDPEFERFGSTEYTGGWFEEAGEIVFKAFDVLKTRIGRHMNKDYNLHPKLLLTANPKKNWLKRIIWKPWKKKILDPIYAYVQSLYKDNHFTADTYGEQLSEITDKITRQRLKEGNWDYDDDDTCLISGEAIQDIWDNPVEDLGGKKYAVLDIARFGKDKTKLYLWDDFWIYRVITWENQDTFITATKVKQILKDEGIPRNHFIGDEIGVGAGVIDQVSGMIGFVANSSPLERKDREKIKVMKNGELKEITPKENFKTLKDQCGWMLADKINNYEVGIDSDILEEDDKEEIEEELSELKDAKPDEDTKKQLVPKDEIKENIGRSPDNLDCMLMRMWFELAPVDEKKKRGVSVFRPKTSGFQNKF